MTLIYVYTYQLYLMTPGLLFCVLLFYFGGKGQSKLLSKEKTLIWNIKVLSQLQTQRKFKKNFRIFTFRRGEKFNMDFCLLIMLHNTEYWNTQDFFVKLYSVSSRYYVELQTNHWRWFHNPLWPLHWRLNFTPTYLGLE